MKWRANRRTSRMRAVGGRLSVEGDALRFEPHKFDAALAAGVWETRLAEISDVDTVSVDFGDFFSGGLRKRLRVRTAAGDELFVVNKAEDVARQLRSLVA